MNRKSSVNIAKDRVKALVTSDRVNCTPECYEKICRELYELLSKYIEFTEDDFHVEITRTHLFINFLGEEE